MSSVRHTVAVKKSSVTDAKSKDDITSGWMAIERLLSEKKMVRRSFLKLL